MCSLPLGNKNSSIFNVIFFLCSILHVMYGLCILNYYFIQHFELLFYIAFYIFYIVYILFVVRYLLFLYFIFFMQYFARYVRFVYFIYFFYTKYCYNFFLGMIKTYK